MATTNNASTSKATNPKTNLVNSLQNALRRKRKHDAITDTKLDGLEDDEGITVVQDIQDKAINLNDQEELRKKAKEIILREAKRSSERAKTMGPQGWLRPRSLNTNKEFLSRTLKSAELSRRNT